MLDTKRDDRRMRSSRITHTGIIAIFFVHTMDGTIDPERPLERHSCSGSQDIDSCLAVRWTVIRQGQGMIKVIAYYFQARDYAYIDNITNNRMNLQLTPNESAALMHGSSARGKKQTVDICASHNIRCFRSY